MRHTTPARPFAISTGCVNNRRDADAEENDDMRCGPERRIRWAQAGTARGPTSRCSPRPPKPVELCLFDDDGRGDRGSRLTETDGFVWHGYVPGWARVNGTASGCTGRTTRRAVCGATRRSSSSTRTPRPSRATSTGTRPSSPTGSTTPAQRNDDDSAAYMPKSVVINPFFDWGEDRSPRTPYHETVIYEAHVKGLTQRHPGRARAASAARTRAWRTRPWSTTSRTWASRRSS